MNKLGSICSTLFGLALLAFVFTRPSIKAVMALWDFSPEWILTTLLVGTFIIYEVIYRLILGKTAKHNYVQALLCVYVVIETVLILV